MDKKTKTKLVVVSAKIPIQTRELIEKKAEKGDRSISYTVARLLASHPELKAKKQIALEV